jgi:hypothetical protein
MAEFLHPGVFVEETPLRARPIEGVPTGVAGFVRVSTEATPVGSFTSAAEFERDNFHWDAARDFFTEGGKRLFVAHAASADAADVAAALAGLGTADVVAAPGLTGPGVAAALVADAGASRRLAVIDPPPGLDVAGVRAFRAGFDSSRAALYWPWPVTTAGAQPPSPAIAGVIARADAERGVWRAPANDVLRTATGFEHAVTKAEQDVLNPLGINCLRSLVGRGNRVWGARTLSSDPEVRYVNVRRQLDWIESSLEAGLQWAVFEPNGEALWADVRNAVGNFLQAHWRDGALQGARPEQAYLVRCDRTTMTQDDLDNGRLVVEIGVAPLKPAEFVFVRIGLWTATRNP